MIENPVEFGKELKAMVGVVEHGLFNGMVNKVIVAGKDGVKILEAKYRKFTGDGLTVSADSLLFACYRHYDF